jgi:hypothetical protein
VRTGLRRRTPPAARSRVRTAAGRALLSELSAWPGGSASLVGRSGFGATSWWLRGDATRGTEQDRSGPVRPKVEPCKNAPAMLGATLSCQAWLVGEAGAGQFEVSVLGWRLASRWHAVDDFGPSRLDAVEGAWRL